MVELKKITKFFSSNGVKALDGANFDLREGEIHVLLGENGAGKSTLMHIMAGFIKPGGEAKHGNPGTILVNGKVQHFFSPAHALTAGIGMVRQHPHHIPGFLVWENCIIGSQKHPPLWVNRRYFRKKVFDLNEQFHFDLPLDSSAETLSVSQGQKAAILTLLLRNTNYLIFDEPTAVLGQRETEKLFELFSVLKEQGKGIVLISHKLEEAINIADRVTVLRQGKTQICCKAFELSNEELYRLIFGIESNGFSAVESSSASPAPPASFQAAVKKPVIALENFSVDVPGHPLIRGINAAIRQGKIVSFAGVRDSGLETLELALTGFLPFTGTLEINGTKINGTGKNPVKRIRSFRSVGGSYLGQRNEGMLLPIRDLLLIHAHRRFQKRGILNRTEINNWIESVMEAAKVPLRKKASAAAFSGGQLQRLLITREMAEGRTLLVLSNPGRGLDFSFRKKLAFLLREKANEKTTILIFSTDIDELLGLSDSIAVLRDGTISKIVEITHKNENRKIKETIQEAMVGQA